MSADNSKQDPWVGSLRTPYKPTNKPFKPTVPVEPRFHTSKRSGSGSRDFESLPAHQRKVSGPLGSVPVQRSRLGDVDGSRGPAGSRPQRPHFRYESPVPSPVAKVINPEPSKFVWELSLRPTTQPNSNIARRDYYAQAKPYKRMTNETTPSPPAADDATRIPRMPQLNEEDDVSTHPLSCPPPVTTQPPPMQQPHEHEEEEYEQQINNTDTPTRSERGSSRGLNPITHEPLPYSPVKEHGRGRGHLVPAAPAASNAPFATEFNTPADDVALDREMRDMGSLDGTPREPVMIDFSTMQAHDTTTFSKPNSREGTPKGTPTSHRRGGSARRSASRLSTSSPAPRSPVVAMTAVAGPPLAVAAVAVTAAQDDEEVNTAQQPETPQQPMDDSFEVVEEPEVEEEGAFEVMRVPAAQFAEEEEEMVVEEEVVVEKQQVVEDAPAQYETPRMEEEAQHVREVSFAADLLATPEEDFVSEQQDRNATVVEPITEETDGLVFATHPTAVLYDESDEQQQQEEEEEEEEEARAAAAAVTEEEEGSKDVEEEEFEDAVEEDTTTDNNLATRNSEELVVPDHNDFVVPEDANVTAEDAEMPGDDTKTEELPAQLSTDEALKHTPAGQRLINQAQIIAQMTVRQAIDQLAAGTTVHKAWLRDGKQKGSTRHVKAKVLNDLVLLTYQSGMVKKNTTVVVIRCCLTIEQNKTTLLLETDNGTLSVQPLTPQHETLWALGVNAMLHVAEKQDALNQTIALEDLSWHGIVQGENVAA